MQPFIAALHAMYDQASTGPRMLWLDRGIRWRGRDQQGQHVPPADVMRPGLADRRTWHHRQFRRCSGGSHLRSAPGAATLPGVSLELAVWAGNELTHVLTPDPADLRDMAAAAEQEDDALFSDI